MPENKKDKLIDCIQKNEKKMYRIAYSYLKNEEMALDTVQDTVEKAIRKIESLKEEQYLETWLYRILINQSLTNLKKNKIKEFFRVEETEEVEKLADKVDIYQAIDKLNIKLKTVILLRFYEDKKIEEIAQITKTNISTVKSRLYKGLQELKKELVEHENK